MQMLKAIFNVLLLCLLANTTIAQDVQYTEYEKFDYRSDEYGIVGMVGDRYYTYLSQGGIAKLVAYDESMNKKATVLLDFFPAKIYETRFIAYPDKMIVLYQALESNKVVQYAALLDDKGLLKGKPIELGSVKTGIFGATRAYFRNAVSEDKKTIVVFSANDRTDQVEWDGKWLDDKLTIVKRSKASFTAENRVEHGEVLVGNDGTVYIAAYTSVGTQNYADQYWILALAPGAIKFEPKELALQDFYAAGGYMKVDNVNRKVYFGGFYSVKKNGNFDGVIYAAYDIATGTFPAMKLLPFDQNLYTVSGARHRAHPFDNYQVRQVIVKNDGGFVLVSEEQFITTRSNYTPGFGYYSTYSPYMTSMVHEYHYDDIMALSYNVEGVLQWDAFIPKAQYSQEDGGVFSSYALLNTGGTLAFLYNDFDPRHSRIQLATLTAEGKTEVNSFSPQGNNSPDWLPRSGKQVSGREMLVPCFSSKQICFAKVSF
jgi:hypothetical protein